MALARGYAASIPIIIRSLANSIAFVPDEKYLPYRLNDSVLHTLDAGEHHQVRTYHLQWWSGPMRKDLENVEILGKLTMMKCLEHFNVEESKATVLPAGTGAGPSNATGKTGGKRSPRKNTKSKYLRGQVLEFFVLGIKTRAGTTSDSEPMEDKGGGRN